MDIVERTGSGVYDVELKARLGDLSGLSSGLLYGNSSLVLDCLQKMYSYKVL